jgi:hypothetical protein
MRRHIVVTTMCLAPASALLLAFSQAGAIVDGDEAFHLLAVGLVADGHRPFVDFFYWHQPLYLYVAASWARLFAESWRSLHMLSALLTVAAVALVAELAVSRDGRGWGGLTAASFFGLNVLVIKWGTIGQNYALAMLLSVIAFRLTVRAVGRPGLLPMFWAGLAAGAAMATSFLQVAVGPVMMAWLFVYRRDTPTLRASCVWLAGCAVPFLPLAWLAWQAPRTTFFDIVTYHVFYRPWVFGSAVAESLRTLSSWMTSTQALLLWPLAGMCLTSVIGTRDADVEARRPFVLCAWLVAGIAAFVTLGHPPPLPSYFVLVSPFLAILASTGVRVLGARVWMTDQTARVAVITLGIFALGLARTAHEEHLWKNEWRRFERDGQEIARVVPSDDSLYASVRFFNVAMGRPAPAGLENPWASAMNINADRAAALHVTLKPHADQRLAEGGFDAVVLLRTDLRLAPLAGGVYRQRLDLDDDFVLLWDPVRSRAAP